jgi:hypothetical protein
MLQTLQSFAQGFRSSNALSSDFNGGHRFFSYRGKGQEDRLKYLTDNRIVELDESQLSGTEKLRKGGVEFPVRPDTKRMGNGVGM